MRRTIIFALICAVAGLLMLTACTRGSGAAPENTTTVTEEEIRESASGPELDLATMYIHEADADNSTVYVDGSHDTIRLSKESEKKYPKLSEGLNDQMNSETQFVKEEIEEFRQARMDNEENVLGEVVPYSIEDKLYVRRADDDILSLLGWHFSYAGGAHGSNWYTALNLDSGTGEPIALDDVVRDKNRLPEILEKELIDKYGESAFFDGLSDTLRAEVMGEDGAALTWTIDPQGLTFYFSPYELASFAQGAMSVTILYQEAEDLFTGRYNTENVKGMIMGIPRVLDTWIDVNGDGVKESVTVNYSQDENLAIQELVVSVGNKDFSVKDLHYYQIDPRLVLTADGKVFLYVIGKSDNDYTDIYPFDLSSGSPQAGDPIALAEAVDTLVEESEDYSHFTRILTDPKNMLLRTRCALLSTYDCKKTFYLTDDPVPRSDEAFYMISGKLTLTSRMEIRADYVDENGDVTKEKQTLPAGSTFTLYRTDAETFVDAKLADGQIVRLYPTGTYPQYLDGVDITQVFEEVFFAG